MKTDILPDTCKVERPWSRHCQKDGQCWEHTDLHQRADKFQRAVKLTPTKAQCTYYLKLKLHHPNSCQQYTQWCSSVWLISRKKHKTINLHNYFYQKYRGKKGFGVCHNICWSSKTASDILNRHRCTILQLSFKGIQMKLGKSSDTVVQGSARPAIRAQELQIAVEKCVIQIPSLQA